MTVPTYQIGDKTFRLLIKNDVLKQKAKELAERINQEYKDKNPILLPILTGSFMFFADVLPHLTIPYEINFVKVSSYGMRMTSSAAPRALMGLLLHLENRHVIVVEDIVDSGKTYQFLSNKLKEMKVQSYLYTALLVKKENVSDEIAIDWMGFDIGKAFVVGYGMDYQEKGRHLKDIYQLV
ncbi:MAG: hypoxanthine phosphoribosyltransferase [Bacteroidia bacterium]|nr:hypoxanthine phosphoribosyltransferase [Bacteroidia bacterium]